MLTFHGKKYAKKSRDVVDSLFERDGATVNGTYRQTSTGIVLCDLQGDERAFVRRDGLGPVTVHRFEGRLRYMFGLSSRDSGWLGEPESYTECCEAAQNLAREFFPPKPVA